MVSKCEIQSKIILSTADKKKTRGIYSKDFQMLKQISREHAYVPFLEVCFDQRLLLWLKDEGASCLSYFV